MDFRKDLAIKYLTGAYKVVSDFSLGISTDLVMLLVDEIKSKRKSKKNWSEKDFVLPYEEAKLLINNEEQLQHLFDYEFIVLDENKTQITLTKKALQIIFDLND